MSAVAIACFYSLGLSDPAAIILSKDGRKGRMAVTSPLVGVEPHVLKYLETVARPSRDIYQFGVYTGVRCMVLSPRVHVGCAEPHLARAHREDWQRSCVESVEKGIAVTCGDWM